MQPSRDSGLVGAAEAEQILGVARTTLHELVKARSLRGRLVDNYGPAHWVFKRSDVLRLKASGKERRHKQRTRRQLELWRRYFGPIPDGLTAAFRDGDRTNTAPDNLCLIPLRSSWRFRPGRVGRQVPRKPAPLTMELQEQVKERFAMTASGQLAEDLGVSCSSVRRLARRLKLRKSREFARQSAKKGNSLPIGTERFHESTGSVWVKVALEGDRHCERWRPKAHVIWERMTGRKVPPRFCIMFKDGDKQNFDPANLELMSKREMSARGFARYLTYPESLQATIKLTKKLEREVRRQELGNDAGTPARKISNSRRGRPRVRLWTAKMDAALRRRYPTSNLVELSRKLGVTFDALRNRARKLRLRRSPDTIIAEARAAAAQTLGAA